MNYYLPQHHRANSGATYYNFQDNLRFSSNKQAYNTRYTSIYRGTANSNSPHKDYYYNDKSDYSTISNAVSENVSLSLKDKVFSPGDSEDAFYNENDIHNTSLLYNSNNISNDLSMSQSIIYSSNQMPKNKFKKTLILDLDETLVHSSFKPFYTKPDIYLKIQYRNEYHNVYVLKRPNVDNFLYQMSKLFNIVVFTASIPEYANPLLDRLDRHKVICNRLFREDCCESNGLYVKDLKVLGKNLKDLIIIDNNPISYSVNKENGIPIKTWHYDKGDIELEKLIPFLTFLSSVDDVRRVIKKAVSNNEVNFDFVDEMLNNAYLSRIENDNTNTSMFQDDKIVSRSRSMKTVSYVNKKNSDELNKPILTSYAKRDYTSDNDRDISHTIKVNKLKEEIINQINTTNPKINSYTIDYSNYNYSPSINPYKVNTKAMSPYQVRDNNNTIDVSSPSNSHYRTNYSFHPSKQIARANSSYCVHKSYDFSNNNTHQKPYREESKDNNLFKSSLYPQKNNYVSNPLYNSVSINRASSNSSLTNLINNSTNNSKLFSKETNYYIKRKMICRQQSTSNISKKKCFFNTSAFSNTNTSFDGNVVNVSKNNAYYNNTNQRTQSSRYLYCVNDRRSLLK